MHAPPHLPPQASSPLWGLPPQEPLFASHSCVSRDPPTGLVAPNPMENPALPLLIETHQPRTRKCLTIHPLHLGMGPPHTIGPLFNTTASGAGLCFSPFLILLLPLSVPLILCVYKFPLFGAPAFLLFKTTPHLPPQAGPATNPRWLFMFHLPPGSIHGFTCFFNRSDVAALDVFGVDLFGKLFSHFRILNLYNLWTKRTFQMTVSPLVAFPVSSFPTLLVGNFNLYHPLPAPLHTHSAEELAISFPYFSRSSQLRFGLLNQCNRGTL